MKPRLFLSILVIPVLLSMANGAAYGAGDSNCVAKYLTDADRQYETREQGEEILRALHDMLLLKPSVLLEKRYRDYQMNRNRWTAIQVLERYFVPTDASRSLSPECFEKSIRTSAAKKAIQKQLDALSKAIESSSEKHHTRNHSSTTQNHLTPPVVSSKETTSDDERLFDNTSMNKVLEKALLSCSRSDMVSAKKSWQEVIAFMRKPRWFPTAAAVPISQNFAKLADHCIGKGQIDDAHELMHAAFEFPFHLKEENVEMDTVASKLIEYDKKNANLEAAKRFLEFAISKAQPDQRSKYQEWLDSIN